MTKKEIFRERRRKLLRAAIPAAAVAGIAAAVIAMAGSESVSERAVVFSTVDSGPIDATVSASGCVAPAFEEIINSPISSRVMEVRCRPGDEVEEGTPLLLLDLHAARIESEKHADMLRMKRLELEQQKAGDNTALGELEMKIKVGAMKVRALEAEHANERYLDSIGSGTTDRVREAEFALRSAELELEQMRRRLADERASRTAAASVKQLEIEIMAKEAAMAQRTLVDAEVRAPRRATVTKIIDKIGSQVSQGQELAVIADLDRYKVEAEAADGYREAIRPGSPAYVRAGAARLAGTVAEVAPTSASGMIKFVVALDDDSLGRLRPGLRTDVYVSNGLVDHALRISNGSYYTAPGVYAMFVRTSDGTLEQRQVTLGVASMDYVEVKRGLEAGEEVVVSDMTKFADKKTIKIKK